VVEGPQGIDNLLHMQLRVDWDHEGYEGVTTSTIKKYNAMIHTQSAIHAMVQLIAANKPRLDVASGFAPGTVVSIEAEVPQITYDFAGGGLYGSLTDVRTKEQAEEVSKFDQLVAGRIDSDLATQIKEAVRSVEHIGVSDLMALLDRVRAS